ncbi:DUF882 domain-containing protein [Nitrincola sp. MINF-07-Sa-05]|uniref:DUF882 domain-containing protein n=1 Tax=Nitrincola salilacus TaxID=3400273 RepID=UPI003918613A
MCAECDRLEASGSQDLSRRLNRRLFIKGCVLAAAGLAMPALAATRQTRKAAEREVALHHLHTGETISTTYWADGRYIPSSLTEINRFLRDFRTGDMHPVDPTLLDLLYTLRTSLDSRAPFEIISAYRSPKTNEMLRSRSANSGVAQRSMHMEGKAIDVRLPGRDLMDLHQSAVAMKAGGVGLYTESGFVHVDTGKVRYW